MKKLIFILSIVFFAQCKTSKSNIEKSNDHITASTATQNNVQPGTQPTGAYPLEPGTCKMHGIIKEILPVDKTNDSEPCNLYPCKARVEITQMNGCGYGVPAKPEVGSVVTINFIYTLMPTAELKLKNPPGVALNGLKVGDAFDGQIKIKNRLNETTDISIGIYDTERN